MNHLNQIRNKIVSRASLPEVLVGVRKPGRRIVFTNGCFDILHKGHVEYLAQAADLGDLLVIGINSDDSVRRLGKDTNRPVNSSDARKTLIAALSFVDLVVEFDEDTPLELIEIIQPDVLVKGGDYDPEEGDPGSARYIVGREIVLKKGGEVKTIDLVQGYSTTKIIEKLK